MMCFSRYAFQVTGAVFGLAASLITFRGLWEAAGIIPPPPPVAAANNEGDRREEEARVIVKEAMPYSVEPDMSVSGSTSSYVEVKGTQA